MSEYGDAYEEAEAVRVAGAAPLPLAPFVRLLSAPPMYTAGEGESFPPVAPVALWVVCSRSSPPVAAALRVVCSRSSRLYSRSSRLCSRSSRLYSRSSRLCSRSSRPVAAVALWVVCSRSSSANTTRSRSSGLRFDRRAMSAALGLLCPSPIFLERQQNGLNGVAAASK